MERERKLIKEIRSVLPEFVQACNTEDADIVLMHQDAFAPKLGDYEILLLGKAVKYAGSMGKSEDYTFAEFAFLNAGHRFLSAAVIRLRAAARADAAWAAIIRINAVCKSRIASRLLTAREVVSRHLPSLKVLVYLGIEAELCFSLRPPQARGRARWPSSPPSPSLASCQKSASRGSPRPRPPVSR